MAPFFFLSSLLCNNNDAMVTEKFMSWCNDQGIKTQLQLRGRHPYRYLTMPQQERLGDDETNDNKKHILLQVPLEACLKDDTEEGLADKLLLEHSLGEKSKLKPFLDMLPPPQSSSIQNLPRFWDADRMESVTDSGQLLKRLMDDEERSSSSASSISRPWTDDYDYKWALACVNSRANFLDTTRDGSSLSYSMAPMLDMLNHDCTVQTKAQVIANDDISISDDNNYDGKMLELSIRGENYQSGQEVFISYGDFTNLDTLCDYGFVSPTNTRNMEFIDIRIIHSPQPISVAISSSSPPGKGGAIDVTSLATLRRLLATPEEMDGRRKDLLSDFFEPLSERNDIEVLSFLATKLDENAKLAREGARKALLKEDTLVGNSLTARADTLEKGIAFILERFPSLEGMY